MNLTYRIIDYNSDDDCKLLSKWLNDKEIRRFVSRFTNEESTNVSYTYEDFKKLSTIKQNNNTKQLVVFLDNLPIGFADYELNSSKSIIKKPQTAFLSIFIGEKNHQGKGLSKFIMQDLEKLAIQDGAKFFEIGVFDFNTKAFNLYQKIGYKEVSRINSFTFWDGKFWDLIVMLKEV